MLSLLHAVYKIRIFSQSEGKIYETKTNKYSFIESCLNSKKKQRVLLYVVDASIVYQTAGTVDSYLNCSVQVRAR